MMIPEFKNARENHLGGVDVDINHPKFGWIPFTIEAGAASWFDVDALADAIGDQGVSAMPSPAHYFVDGAWQVAAPSDAEMLTNLRLNRNQLLADCDWTQLPDAPLTEAQCAAWLLYRQALRDITDSDDLLAVTWPDTPA